ncbi:MAG TPA: DUF2971 domain-containing protein [Candidatus Saccharimonadales bacterium]|nr:DUF2971 domain-containing protein [Candidatus Saccharimonadales bacterium]
MDNSANSKPLEALRGYGDGTLWNRLNELGDFSAGSDFFEFPPPIDLRAPLGTPPPILYHYTDARGLDGILKGNSLWASAAYFLNDSSEIEYGCQILLNELRTWLEPNRENKCFTAQVLRGINELFGNVGSRLSRSINIYVACFCEQGNLLSQWRAYGQGGGYAIGFRSPLDATMRSNGPHTLRLSKVIYDKLRQTERVGTLLRDAILAVNEAFGDQQVDDLNLLGDTVWMIQELILDEIVRFKHPAFLDEREWRLVARFDPRTTIGPAENINEPFFHFRNSNGYMIPYIVLKPTAARLPVVSIRFGPSMDFRRYENSTRLFLADAGYPQVDLTGSDLPVIL